MHPLRSFGVVDLRFFQKKVEMVTETVSARGGFHCFLLRNSEDWVDLFKNGLGLVLTILILSYFPKEEVKRRDFAALAFASVLLSVAHQLSYLFFLAVIAFVATPLYLFPWRGWRKCRDVAWLLPSFVIFLLTYIGFYLPPQFPAADGVNVSFASVGYIPASISPFINYLSMYQGSYGALSFDVLSVFAFLYLPVIPFAFVGRFRQRILFAWTAIALLVSFQVLLTPSFGFWYWDRWMLLLFLPLLLYAVEGIRRIISKIRLKTVKAIALLLIVTPFAFVNSGFMLLPPDHAFLYFRDPAIWPHFQSSMLSNTLPLQDTEDTLNVLAALNMKMNSSTVLLVHQAFYGWAVLTVTGKTSIIDYFLGNPDEVVPLALERGFKVIYTIWWTNGYGWYGQQMPDDFRVILTYGRIAAYLYTG